MSRSSTAARTVIDFDKKWYEVSLPLRTCSLKDIANTTTTKEQIDAYFHEAQQILDEETKSSELDRGRWYSAQFLARGTIADKVASAAVKLTDNDFMFFLDGFNLLFDTARADTHHYEAALKALSAIWPKLLPPRPLKRFAAQYFATLPQVASEQSCNNDTHNSNNTSSDNKVELAQKTILTMARRKVLLYWYLEDHLKRTYSQFLSLCETMLKDRVVQRRSAWMNVVGKLMCTVAESRHLAMSMMIDKLGDPSSQLAHQAYHHLLKLLSESSTHQAALFTELEKIIFMKNCPLRTMRYAANVMNQFVYSKEERKLALRSVHTYLSLFRQLALSGAADSTVTTAILVGLRRAFPYAGADLHSLHTHLDALFVLANNGNFQQRIATMSLLQLIVTNKGTPTSFLNRWYRTLYHLLLLSPKLIPQTTQLSSFFAMLHKAMRTDTNEERVTAFVHRLLQRALYFNPAMICAILLLVGEMVSTRIMVRRLIQPVSTNIQKSSKHTYHSAFSKEQMQVHKDVPLANNKTSKSSHIVSDTLLQNNRESKLDGVTSPKLEEEELYEEEWKEKYDPRAREPQFARASHECLWVLNTLARHFHPSVVKLSVLLLFGDEVIFDVHPLDDMTPANFLQMFVDVPVHDKTSPGNKHHPNSSHDNEAEDNNGLHERDVHEHNGAMWDHNELGDSGGNEHHTGISVFRRAAHIPHIPNASDPYFIHASASEVDVAALFLHRYAVQREKFHRALTQTNSTWGDASGEEDVALRVSNLDHALFGPEGTLNTSTIENAAMNSNVDDNKIGAKRQKKQKAIIMDELVERDEDVPSSSDDDNDDNTVVTASTTTPAVSVNKNAKSDKLSTPKTEPSLNDNSIGDIELKWGYDNDEDDDDEHENDISTNNSNSNNHHENKNNVTDYSLSEEEEEEEELWQGKHSEDDDEEEEEEVLGRTHCQGNFLNNLDDKSQKKYRPDEDNGEDFAREIEQHVKQPSQKRQREERWLNERESRLSRTNSRFSGPKTLNMRNQQREGKFSHQGRKLAARRHERVTT